jgi:tetratricopeptide (TPR) repeat protein
MPELLCRTSLQAGDFEWGRRQVEAAQARYHDAAQADPRAIEPLERLAEVAFQQWRTTGRDQNFDEATQRLAVLTTALPFASRFHRRLGQAWLARFNRSKLPDHAQQAVKAFDSAVECYPHHAELLSEWAIACDGAGQREKAREAARQAIHQDNLNRQAGHSDKFLSADTRQRMEHLAD